MNLRGFRNQWLRYRDRYERKGMAIFRRSLRKAALRIPFDNLDDYHYKMSVDFNITEQAIQDAYFDFYYTIGLAHGKRTGRDINRQLKQFDPDTFEEQYRSLVNRWLLEFGGSRISSVREELAKYLIKYITDQIAEGLTMDQIVRNIQKHIMSRGFYRWQIERIVRTETTAAANFGAVSAGKSSGVLVDKVWVSSHNGRTRRIGKGDLYDHWEMDGQKVALDEKFKVPGLRGVDFIDYPGDPTGEPGNVINCRCAVAKVPRRDENGRLVYR